jgi:transposase
MRPTSAAKHSSVVSLLTQGYPHCQIHAKTGVNLGTISKINKELDSNKENNHGGCPSKLSARDKQSIIHQITSGKLDNAVQATQFINNTLTNPVYPQTVRDALKEAGLWSATKKKVPMLKQTHWQRWLKFAHYVRVSPSRTPDQV